MSRYFNESANLAATKRRDLLIGISRIKEDIKRLKAGASRSTSPDMADEAVLCMEQEGNIYSRIAKNYLRLGSIHLEFFDTKMARIEFGNALKFDPSLVPAYLGLGRIELELGKYETAAKHFEAVLSFDSGNPVARYFIGKAYWEQRSIAEAERNFIQSMLQMKTVLMQMELGGPQCADIALIPGGVGELVASVEDVDKWRRLTEDTHTLERDLARLKYIAGQRPLYIATIMGRGWVLSHMVLHTEMLIRRLWMEGVTDPFIIMLNPDRFCNEAVRENYARSIWMVDERYPRLRRRLMALREWLKSQGSPIAAEIDPENPVTHTRNNFSPFQRGFTDAPPTLQFNARDHARGKALIAQMGIPEDAEYVSFGIRESSYYRRAWLKQSQKRHYWEAAWENGRRVTDPQEIQDEVPSEQQDKFFKNMMTALDVPLENYLPMAEELARSGIYVLRTGLRVDNPISADQHPRIIDYASQCRSDFGDFYLFSTSKFLVSGATGNNCISVACGRPYVFTDSYVAHMNIMNSHPEVPNIFIPRLYWLKPEKRLLTFSEMIDCCRRYQHQNLCDEDGVEVIRNTPEEIVEVVDEMNRRVDGTWREAAEDDEFQERFRSLYLPRHEGYGANGNIGAAFLRRYADLLE